LLLSNQGLFSFSRLAKCTGSWEGTQPGELTQLTKGYSIPYGVMLSIEAGGDGREAAIAARGRDGYCSSGGEQLHCASLVLCIKLLLLSSSFLPLLSY